jgi:uncharacterized repeat protein (TIGR03837 family)
LWIDDVARLARLHPRVEVESDVQEVDGVCICRWRSPFPAVAPAKIVVEAFGCGIPPEYEAAMVAGEQHSLWLVLEYLSAEPWVATHHGQPSPPPRSPLDRYFFFPGFSIGTGGVLRERDLFARREAFDSGARAALWQKLGHEAPDARATTVSLFAYELAPLRELLATWEQGPTPTIAVVPEGRLAPLALAHLGASETARERVFRRGALELRIVPFVPQSGYDELLWACDVNFVRGEDSFVRAQWAARPFVWQIYPQDDSAHVRKLEAFLDLYCEGLPGGTARAVSDMMRAWNGVQPGVSIASAWPAFAGALAALREHGEPWAARVSAIGDLAGNLDGFWRRKVKNG